MFALSTAWNADRSQDGAKIAEEIENLGIKNIELNFSLTKKAVGEIARYARQKDIRITSLHNYCPIPEGFKVQDALPDCFSLSSIDEEERRKAVEQTKITISTAKKLRAACVILHCGRVEIEDKTRELISLAMVGRKTGQTYTDLFEACIKERREKSPDFFAQVLKSLEDLCSYAQKSDVVLGIENRFYYREIPDVEELGRLFDRFRSTSFAYWHDIGHSYILEKLGFIKEGILLRNFGKRLYGVHLHNIKNYQDHRAPTEGEFDFAGLKPYMDNKILKVIEVHGHVKAEEIKDSVSYLKGVLGD